ncbi:MAG TPA: alpha/beta hydrolase [Acidobacteriota bacterium]|jgi:phospholipase/carboxylesterase/glyoxalase family protein
MSAEDLGFIHRYTAGYGRASQLTLLLLHGTGGDENDLLGLGEALAPGAALLSPRGKVLENGMPRFFRRLSEGVFDLEDLKARTLELAEFVRNASVAYHLPSDKIVAAGFSNGANIAASMLLLRPDVLAGAVLFRPMVPFIPEQAPDLSNKNVFIAAGEFDPIVGVEQPEQLRTMLGQAGAHATLRWFPSGHAISSEEVVEARSWLSGLIPV